MLLSKSRYVSGLQCHKQLWWKVHEPDAPELVPSAAQAALFDTARRVGARARAVFPGGTQITLDPRDVAPAVRATREALARGAQVIFEAAFEHDGAFAAIDVLERSGDGFVLIEVKATGSAKSHHNPDLALQAHLARCAGLRIERIEVMHVDAAHRHPDLHPLFARRDVTERVNALVPLVAERIAEQRRMLEGACPKVAIGPHCKKPYPCAFASRCSPELPAHHVSELYGAPSRAERLAERGYTLIRDVPDDEKLGAIAARQRRAVLANELVVEDGLSTALDEHAEPIAFLDFEAISGPLPIWQGTAPFQAVPAQFSLHRLGAGGSVQHVAHLAQGPSDPRPVLAERLLEATREAATVFAWAATYERGIVEQLARELPALRSELRALHDRIVDLLPIVKRYVYHPEFHGSFSLKDVGPALAPQLGYAGLAIADGETAARELQRHLLDGADRTHDGKQDLRAALLAYCERDTELLVHVWRRLRAAR